MSIQERPESITKEDKRTKIQGARNLGHLSRKYNHTPIRALQQLLSSDEELLDAYIEGAIQADIKPQKDR